MSTFDISIETLFLLLYGNGSINLLLFIEAHTQRQFQVFLDHFIFFTSALMIIVEFIFFLPDSRFLLFFMTFYSPSPPFFMSYLVPIDVI